MKKCFQIFFILLFTLIFSLIRPSYALASGVIINENEKVRVSLLAKYDSADTAIVKQVNTYAKSIQFRNHDIGKNYTLTYDNTSMIYDVHGNPMSASMLEVGQVVNITFLKGVKHLNSLAVSADAWVEAGVNDFDLVSDDETAKIKGTVLHITPKTLIISEGQAVNPEDILSTDTLRVSGIDKEIYSIVVTKGHGYVSLSSDTVNDRSLVGAWIELDKEVIRKITPRMLISAPEGTYNVAIMGNGAKFSSEIVVNRNEETVIDTSVAEVEKIKEGNVTFVVTPEESRVFVDGEEVLTEVPHSYTYGMHKLHVMADGYEPQDHTLKVAEPDATLFIELEEKEGSKDKEAEEEASSEEESSEEVDSAEESSTIVSDEPKVATSTDEWLDEMKKKAADAARSKSDSAKKKSNTKASSSSSTGSTASVDSEAAATQAPAEEDTATDSGTGTTNTSDAASTSNTGDSSDGENTEDKDNVISGYKVTFDAPIGAEVYMDGNYVGIMPVSFAKTPGKHTITLQKDGFETKSYTIQVDKEQTNVTYSFPEMVPVKNTDNPDENNSGNNDSTDSGDENKPEEGKQEEDRQEEGKQEDKQEEVSGGQP